MTWTIDAIKEADNNAGRHFFEKSTMRFFSSRILPTVYEGPGGIYFITSEQFQGSDGVKAPRKYTIRQFIPKPVNIRTVAGFNSLPKAKARVMARGLASGKGVALRIC